MLCVLHSGNKNTEYAQKILKKSELALVQEHIAWTHRQVCKVDERIA